MLLLPDTDAEGCRQVAEKVTQLPHLAKCRAHGLNLPSRKVTVSLGGATRRSTTQSGSYSLVEDAESAVCGQGCGT